MMILFNQVKDTLGKDVMYSCPGGCSRKQLENKVIFILLHSVLKSQTQILSSMSLWRQSFKSFNLTWLKPYPMCVWGEGASKAPLVYYAQNQSWLSHVLSLWVWFHQDAMQGYKEFTVHMSSFHGGLDMVMAMDGREEVGLRWQRSTDFNINYTFLKNYFKIFGLISNLPRWGIW